MFIIANINPNYIKQSFTLGTERKNQNLEKKLTELKKELEKKTVMVIYLILYDLQNPSYIITQYNDTNNL